MQPTQNPPVAVVSTPADILRAAALYLQRHGWYQRDYYARSSTALFPPACATGAIRMAVYGRRICGITDMTTDEYRAVVGALVHLATYLDDTFPTAGTDLDAELELCAIGVISVWNDATWRTVDEVIGELEAAADTWHPTTDGGASA
jgi:hypothetical protein